METSCDVYVRASNISLCKEIDVICFLELMENGNRRRFTVVIGFDPDDNNFDDFLEEVCNKIRDRGDGYKNNDYEFKDFLTNIANVHQDDHTFGLDPYENPELFRQLYEFLLSP